MKIRILGAGWYGCSIGHALLRDGHEVEIHELRGCIFNGASGHIPARLHQGFHYPRSRITRAACQEHQTAFMERYGFLTRSVPVNIYAIAATDSLVDFDQYRRTLEGEVQFVEIHDPAEFGLEAVEGAVLTGERHIVSDLARAFFENELRDRVRFHVEPGIADDSPDWDLTIDCTFGAGSAIGVDRYEPCLVLLLEGPTERAVTIMDGPFPSLYPWDEGRALSSLSSALYSPFSKDLHTWAEAAELLRTIKDGDVKHQADMMVESMARFYPRILTRYETVQYRTSIRAMPASGADTRLVDVRRESDRLIRVRAGKIDAVIHAEQAIREMIG